MVSEELKQAREEIKLLKEWAIIDRQRRVRQAQESEDLRMWAEERLEALLLPSAPKFIKRVAPQYLLCLIGNQSHQGIKGSNASSSRRDPFLNFMAQETGKPMEDTAHEYSRLISQGIEAGGFEYMRLAKMSQALNKTTLLEDVNVCRGYLERFFAWLPQYQIKWLFLYKQKFWTISCSDI